MQNFTEEEINVPLAFAKKVSARVRELMRQPHVSARLQFPVTLHTLADNRWQEVAALDALAELDRMVFHISQEQQFRRFKLLSRQLPDEHTSMVVSATRNFLFAIDALHAAEEGLRTQPADCWLYYLIEQVDAVLSDEWSAALLDHQLNTRLPTDTRFIAHVLRVPESEAEGQDISRHFSHQVFCSSENDAPEVWLRYSPVTEQDLIKGKTLNSRLRVPQIVQFREPTKTLAQQLALFEPIRDAAYKLVGLN